MAKATKNVKVATAPKATGKRAATEARGSAAPVRRVVHKDFAQRMQLAAEGNPNVPPHNLGRLQWFTTQLDKRGVKTSPEGVRKWFAGETFPRPNTMTVLAEVLSVDQAWLAVGASKVDDRVKRVRQAEADGAVNVLAGFITMCGGNPAFPVDGDARAQKEAVDLYAIIRGAQYAIHVSVAKVVDGAPAFVVPVKARDLLVIGVVRTSDLTCDFYDLGSIEDGVRSGDAVTLPADNLGDFRKITTFADRI